ncbi:MAG: hypothetical protein WA139_04280 [Candidatus Aenigmatarchaeota archaeon]
MYEAEIIERFSKVPVFSLADAAQIIQNRGYAKKFLARMVRRKRIVRIKKDLYTLHSDSFLAATFLLKPSYISGVSALSYHKKITQIPKEVFCHTSKPARKYFFIERINFYHTEFFFGFEMRNYLDFDIPVATAEKAIIDSIGKFPLSVIDEAFDDIDVEKMLSYLERIKKSSIVKRVGYLLEIHGHDVFPKLEKYVNNKHVPLDPIAKPKGIKSRKWKIIA